MIASAWADRRGAYSVSIACSSGLVSADVRHQNTRRTRSRIRPERSSATIVFAKVAGESLWAIASTSASCSAIPASSAGRKCSMVMSANGGSRYGRSLAVRNGLSGPVSGITERA